MTSTITEMALALSASVELSILSKATVILVLGLTSARLAGRARASVRHLFLTTTLVTVLALPLIAVLAPRVTIEIPVPSANDTLAAATAVSLPDVSDPSTPSAPARGGLERGTLSAPRGRQSPARYG